MTKLLRLNTSLFTNQGVSNQLLDELIQGMSEKQGDLTVIERDFARDPIPHLDGERLQALMTPAEQRSPTQQAMVDYADALIAELQSADVVVIGLPMYNFNIPSMLKAWFDHVARVGVTFKYTDQGPVGLLDDKPVYLVTTRGGVYREQPSDVQIPFVKTFLQFLGLTQIRVIYAEGLNLGDEQRERGLQSARQQIAELAAA